MEAVSIRHSSLARGSSEANPHRGQTATPSTPTKTVPQTGQR